MTLQARTVIGYGLAGSLLILCGSLGVGWFAADAPLTRLPLLIWLRSELFGVALSVVALTAGCWVLFHAWLRLKHLAVSLRVVTAAALAWTSPQLLAVPIFSRDVFAYVNQGRLILAGENPYITGVSSLDNWFQRGTDIGWAEDATPYGPLFLWIAAGVMRVSADSAELAVLLFRLVCVAGVALILIFVPKLAEQMGTDPVRAQWVVGANPLLIISFISSAHNDALMVGLALAGTWCAIGAGRRRGGAHWVLGLLALVLMAASIGTKLITLVMLPFIGLLWAGTRASWPARLSYWMLTAGLTGAILAGLGALGGFGLDWVSVLAGTGSGASFWAPLTILVTPLAGLWLLLGHSPDIVYDVAGTLGRMCSVVVVLWLMFRGEQHRAFHRMMWAFAAVVLLSPLIQPWYLLWILPLFAAAGHLTGGRRRWPLALTVGATGFFLAFGAADQLFVHQFLQADLMMMLISAAVSVAGVTLIWFLDAKARSVVLSRDPAAP